jgi:hypothetical protein
MHAATSLIEHPYALAVFAIAALYAWSVFGRRPADHEPWGAKRVIRNFAPGVMVLIAVLAASVGLEGNLPRVDFGMFYSSALLLRQDPQHLYDPQTQTELLHEVTGLAGEPHYLPFAYPPIVAFLFIPLTALSFKSAYFLMLAVNTLLLIVAFWSLSAKLHYREDQLTAFLVTASAALPMYAALILGHLTFFGLLLLSLFVTDLAGNRKWQAGLWAGCLLYKPILFPVPLLILLWKKQWRAIGLFVLMAAAMFLFSLALVGWNGLQANLRMLRIMTSDYLLPKTQSLRGLTFFAGLGTGTWVVLVIVALAALWFAILRARDQRWTMAGAIIAMMLVPPYLQFYDLSIGLVAVAIALTTMNPVSDKTRNNLFLIALVPPALVLATPRNQPGIPIMPIVLVLLFIYCLWRAFSNGEVSPGTQRL